MSVAHDIFSETNPGFCACVLVAFTTAYTSINVHGPEIPSAYLSLPVALSGDLWKTFEGTNKNTGLLEWLERSPQVQIALADRLNASMSMVTEAIRLGCFSRVLRIDTSARLGLGDQKLKKAALSALGPESAQVIRRAERLGYWFATAGSTRSVFDMMGLTA